MRNRRGLIIGAIATLIVLGTIYKLSHKQADGILIVAYAPLSGQYASMGKAMVNGAKLEVDRLNEMGGVNGKPLTLRAYDDGSDSNKVWYLLLKVLRQDKPTLVVGDVTSDFSYPAAQLCNKSHTPMISPGASSDHLTAIGSFIFHTCLADSAQGMTAADFASSKLHAKTAAVIYNKKDTYSSGLAKAFCDEFKARGGYVSASETYTLNDNTFVKQVDAIASAKPAVLYIPGYYTYINQIAEQARRAGIHATFLGSDGWADPQGLRKSGVSGHPLSGAYYVNPSYVNFSSPLLLNFSSQYRSKSSADPDILSALSYDTIGLAAAAIAKTGPPVDGDYSSIRYHKALRASLATIKYLGITGTLQFDERRNPNKKAPVFHITDGRSVLVPTS